MFQICLPGFLQSLLKTNTCQNKTDCGCDVYTEEICIQKQREQVIDVKTTETDKSFSSRSYFIL